MELGLPRKVLRDFAAVGVHADCVIAAETNAHAACDVCHDLMLYVLDEHYGHIDKDIVVDEIKKDVLRDRLGE